MMMRGVVVAMQEQDGAGRWFYVSKIWEINNVEPTAWNPLV